MKSDTPWRTPAPTRSLAAALALAALAPATPALAASADEPTPRAKAEPPPRLELSRQHVPAGGLVIARGRVAPAAARRRTVILERRTGRSWTEVARTRTAARRFRAAWRPATPGSYRLRARLGGRARSSAVSARSMASVAVYRRSPASWYGPGLYGNRTACGQTLTPSTLGVANKSLPCGTRVTFRHRGRSVTVRVIDRGPFVGNRVWDLTAATKHKLGFGSTGMVWATR